MSAGPRASSVDGIVLLDKPAGMTSNAALQCVKRLFGARKAGHTGSLDPLASGMLPICLGEATKVAGALLGGRKRYRFTIALGQRTASGDLESEVVEELPVPQLDMAHASKVIALFAGSRLQTPPMYSALKHQGEPLYRLARRGIEVERAPREIAVDSIELESRGADRVVVSATCSKGTYIRSLAEEIAVALGTCGHVAELRRLWSEPFAQQAMHDLDTIAATAEEHRARYLMPADTALQDLPRIDLDREQARLLLNGVILTLSREGPIGRVRLYDPEGRFLGVGNRSADGELRPQRLAARLVTPEGSG